MTRAPHHPKIKHAPKHPPANPPANPPADPAGQPAGATPPPGPIDNTGATALGRPVFSQPQPTPDPTQFEISHGSDNAAYAIIDKLNAAHKLTTLPFPMPRGLPEPRLTMAEILGPQGASAEKAVLAAKRLVFHSVGDTGSTRGPDSQNLVSDKMVGDYSDPAENRPSFFLHLGDVVYSFGEAQYYYDQFYDPYRDYPAPIVALAGNHDGMVSPLTTDVASLDAFLRNFCADTFEVTPEAGGLSRTAQIQPGVFYTFEAPLLRVLVLYSGTLEDPGVIADADIGQSQIDYLDAALARVKSDKFAGALIIAHHHPAYTAGSKHGWSEAMLAQIDAACQKAHVWPHAVLSAHAHNYQRFTRHHAKTQIPYIVAGNGGHGLAKLSKVHGATLRTPMALQVPSDSDPVTLENYDDQDYGYLRIIVTDTQLRIEYHPASDGTTAKTPDDSVTVDLASRMLVHFTG